MLSASASLCVVRLIHTLAWVFFVGCILAIPAFAWQREFRWAGTLIVIVFVEVLVILLNNWRCPLTAVAARFTDDRRDNFDIYLPVWLARHNKLIFGSLFLAGVLFTIGRWSVG
jgi:hypothetical protein